VHNLCLVNGMKINVGKTTIISTSRKKTVFILIINCVIIWSRCTARLQALFSPTYLLHTFAGFKNLRFNSIHYVFFLHSWEPFGFCTVHFFSLNLSMHRSFRILSLLQMPNLKELKENLQHYVTPDCLHCLQVHLNMKTF
jgi:hypothetical protein